MPNSERSSVNSVFSFRPASSTLDRGRKADLLGHAVQRQLAGDFDSAGGAGLNLGRFEVRRGKLRTSKKSGLFKWLVSMSNSVNSEVVSMSTSSRPAALLVAGSTSCLAHELREAPFADQAGPHAHKRIAASYSEGSASPRPLAPEPVPTPRRGSRPPSRGRNLQAKWRKQNEPACVILALGSMLIT